MTAIITERGIARAPYSESLAELVNSGSRQWAAGSVSRQPAAGCKRTHRSCQLPSCPLPTAMIILGIETSCDETAAAVVEETGDAARPWRLRSSVVASQVDIHREWGGVVPELSARQHVRDICGVVERALADAGVAAIRRRLP